MHRIVISFSVGLIAGFVMMQVVCRGFLLFAEGDPSSAALQRQMSPADYQTWVDARFEMPFMLASLAVAIACACACGWAARPMGAVRRKRNSSGDPLMPDEIRTVARACRFCDLTDKGADYLQGLIVGRLVETEPALARKVDGYNTSRMERVLTELLRRQDSAQG